MEWRMSSLVLLATSPLVPHSALPAQTANAAHHLSIVEPRAQAILEQKSIRLELPLSDPATGNERVVAWLLSPVNVSSGETASTLKPGARSANLALPWPNDGNGKPVDDIGWYRIGYRIESADTTVARGILSVGAIAPNLLAIRLARPSRAVAGMPTSVHVFAANPVTQRPFKGVRLKATLNLDEDVDKGKTAKRKLVRRAITDVSGEATFTFPAPVKPGDTATLEVE